MIWLPRASNTELLVAIATSNTARSEWLLLNLRRGWPWDASGLSFLFSKYVGFARAAP